LTTTYYDLLICLPSLTTFLHCHWTTVYTLCTFIEDFFVRVNTTNLRLVDTLASYWLHVRPPTMDTRTLHGLTINFTDRLPTSLCITTGLRHPSVSLHTLLTLRLTYSLLLRCCLRTTLSTETTT